MKDSLAYRDSAWVAQRLGLDEATVLALMESGGLPGFKLGPKWLVSEDKLREFLQEEEERRAGQRNARSAPRGRGLHARSRSKRPRQEIMYLFLGRQMVARTSKELLLNVLRGLSERDATFLPRFSGEGGRKRRYVAQDPLDLYPGRPQLARAAKEELQTGWWVGTNYSANDIESILRKACQAAGLKWGKDLIIRRQDTGAKRQKAWRFVGIAADTASDVSRRHSEYFAETLIHAGR